MDANEFRRACTEAALHGHCSRQAECGSCHYRNMRADWRAHTYCNDDRRRAYCINQPCDMSLLTAEGDYDCPIYQGYMKGKSICTTGNRRYAEYKADCVDYATVDSSGYYYRPPHPLTIEREYKKNGTYEAEHWELMEAVEKNFGF